MREFVGVRGLLDILFASDHEPGRLKRELLIFDRIAVTQYESCVARIRKRKKSQLPDFLKELDWLIEQGLVFDAGGLDKTAPLSDEYKAYGDEAAKRFRLIDEAVKGVRKNSRKYEQIMIVNGAFAVQCQTRMASISLRDLHGLDAYPVFFLPVLPMPIAQRNKKQQVANICFKALPIPDDSTPWEQIIEYRSDPDSQSKFLALRYWMSEVARAELTPAEVEEKLEYLVNQYQKHMKLHRMKTNVGTLETVVTTGAEVLGDLVSFKWGKAAEALFSLKRRQVALLEGELTAPGNEVAYIVKARETFDS